MSDQFLTIPMDESYCDFNQPRIVPSLYVVLSNYPERFYVEGEDDLNKVLMKYAEKSGSFDFLSDPKEDVYNWGDGEPL